MLVNFHLKVFKDGRGQFISNWSSKYYYFPCPLPFPCSSKPYSCPLWVYPSTITLPPILSSCPCTPASPLPHLFTSLPLPLTLPLLVFSYPTALKRNLPREVQGHESNMFQSYFDQITVMEGGADTGFRHVPPECYEPRLLQLVGGKKGVVVRYILKLLSLCIISNLYIIYILTAIHVSMIY